MMPNPSVRRNEIRNQDDAQQMKQTNITKNTYVCIYLLVGIKMMCIWIGEDPHIVALCSVRNFLAGYKNFSDHDFPIN